MVKWTALILVLLAAQLMSPMLSSGFRSCIRGDSSPEDKHIVYVAPVIHMNQLLENVHTVDIYGHNAYRVFLEESRIPLEIPGAKLTVDITGPTLISLMATAPDILENFKRGVGNGSVEILGVTFGQIPVQYLPYSHVEKHVQWEEKLLWSIFHVKPRGLWQEDRQWTPQLPYIISRLGYEYTLIDDNVFLRGNPEADNYTVYYPHIASYNGSSITVFHISEYMRYHFRRNKTVNQLVNYLEDILNHTRDKPIPPIVVYGDDAEFGLNPDVFRKLSRIPWVKFTTLHEYIDKYREYLTSANYNVTGAYREYESMFGRDWYKWYNGTMARLLTAMFDEAGKQIAEAGETGVRELIDAAWIYLLLAEWQYGPFYNYREGSNREYLVDTIIYSRLAQGNNTGYREEKVFGHNIGIYISGDWGIGIDYTRNTIRAIVNYRYDRMMIPPKIFNTTSWWRYTPPGILFEKTSLLYGQGKGRELIIKTREGEVTITGNRILTINATGLIKLDTRILPGNLVDYILNGFPGYNYTAVNDNVRITDQWGNGINIAGIKGMGQPVDEGFSIHIPGVKTSNLEIRITGKGRVQTSNTTSPATNNTTRSSPPVGGNRGSTGPLPVNILVSLLTAGAAGIVCWYYWRRNR